MQDISLSVRGRNVSRSSGWEHFAEIKAADRMPLTFGRRLCILIRYVGAVLTASFSPAAPIQLIENALKAGPGASAISNGMDLLSSAPTLSATALSLIHRLDRPRMDQEGKRRSLHAMNFTNWR